MCIAMSRYTNLFTMRTNNAFISKVRCNYMQGNAIKCIDVWNLSCINQVINVSLWSYRRSLYTILRSEGEGKFFQLAKHPVGPDKIRLPSVRYDVVADILIAIWRYLEIEERGLSRRWFPASFERTLLDSLTSYITLCCEYSRVNPFTSDSLEVIRAKCASVLIIYIFPRLPVPTTLTSLSFRRYRRVVRLLDRDRRKSARRRYF